MNEIILLLLSIVGIFSVACSVALIALGKIIDNFPLGDEETRTRGISSPAESTKLAVVLFWVLFVPGAWAVLQEGIVTRIVGITLLFSICLFMFTGLVFSFAVLSTMKGRKNAYGDTVLRIRQPVPQLSPSPPVTVKETMVRPKRRENPLSNVMVNALLKK
jgi:hypothetical protein